MFKVEKVAENYSNEYEQFLEFLAWKNGRSQ